MQTIGLLGGMTSASSIEYYRIINELTREKLGGIHSGRSIMLSVDFAPIDELMEAGKWNEICDMLVADAQRIEKAGADFLLICTNTMHKLADTIQEAIRIPILHIIDATAEQVKKEKLTKIGLLGTRFTMEENFYKGRLKDLHGIEVLVPGKEDRETIHRIIGEELSIGNITSGAKESYRAIIERLVAQGAEGIILGCTEIPLLVKQAEYTIPIFDTTYIHAAAAVAKACAE